MADKYPDFETLAQHERADVDYRIVARRAQPDFGIFAPHGGAIEAGTSEVAGALAGRLFTFYGFEGIKSSGNSDLHITSTRFDEPLCLELARDCTVIVTIHGESDGEAERVIVGGLDRALGAAFVAALTRAGFSATDDPPPELAGVDSDNLCNRGRSGAGVQLELSRGLRGSLFESLTKTGRQRPLPRFDTLVSALRSALVGRLGAR
jgi:phage replication-related protein YjqB (UPF0714/DUF867 family)